MAAAPITRSRSLHLAGRTHLPPPPPSFDDRPQTPSASSTSSSSSSTAATVAVPSQHSAVSVAALLPSTTSNVALFLTNMRLLDLDQRPDWPDITAQTFVHSAVTTTAGAQGQRQRVRCVEWALVMLFGIWDHEEARSKLYPLFPPTDQVQSVALRSALLRLLEQAKKNGVLGRDVLVRKTMLDECKGDRLEEVLAVFSSAVLKKVVAEHTASEERHPALAESLALEQKGYADERTELAVLALAHKVSLRKTLQDKEDAKQRFTEFSGVLDAKEMAIRKRTEQARVDAQLREHNADADKVWEAVRHNWTGDERWVDALQHGDTKAAGKGLLGMPFSRVWRRVEAGRFGELEEEETQSAGLLEQLEGRVKTHKTRLEKWKAFQQDLEGPKDGTVRQVATPEKASKGPRGVELGFGAHESLKAIRVSTRKASISVQPKGSLDTDYASLIQSLQSDLVGVQGDSSAVLDRLTRPVAKATRRPSAPVTAPATGAFDDDASEGAVDSDNEPTPRPRRASIRDRISLLRSSRDKPFEVHHEPSLPHEPSSPKASLAALRTSRSSVSSSGDGRLSSSAGSPTSTAFPPLSPPRSPRRTNPPRPPSQTLLRTPQQSPQTTPRPARRATVATEVPADPFPISQSPTQLKADQILASMAAVSPTPSKPSLTRHLSLADRARLSMVRSAHTQKSKLTPTTHQDTSLMDYGDDSTMSVDLAMAPPTPCPPSSSRRGVSTDDANDIVARTRLSMAGFEAAQQKARLGKQLAAKKEKEAKRAIVGTGRATKESWLDVATEELLAAEQGKESDAGDGESVHHSVNHSAVVQEEYDGAGDAEADVSILAEELIVGGQQDYDAVFRSRPRLKASPVVSRMPSSEWPS